MVFFVDSRHGTPYWLQSGPRVLLSPRLEVWRVRHGMDWPVALEGERGSESHAYARLCRSLFGCSVGRFFQVFPSISKHLA